MIHSDKLEKIQKYSSLLSSAAGEDLKVSRMPVVRVKERPTKAPLVPLAKGRRMSKKSSVTIYQPAKSRINYQELTAKAQKAFAQNLHLQVNEK